MCVRACDTLCAKVQDTLELCSKTINESMCCHCKPALALTQFGWRCSGGIPGQRHGQRTPRLLQTLAVLAHVGHASGESWVGTGVAGSAGY